MARFLRLRMTLHRVEHFVGATTNVILSRRMQIKFYFVYLLTNYTATVLYTGVTNSLERRVWQHRNGVFEGFSKKYKCDRLVYFEDFRDIKAAIAREKQIKGWTRARKN